MSHDFDDADCERRRRAAKLLLDIVEKDWTADAAKVPVRLLRALCELERDDPSPDGHDGLALAQRMAASGDRDMRREVEKAVDGETTKGDEGAAARAFVRKRWGRLRNEFWPERCGEKSLLEMRFRESGLGVIAHLYPEVPNPGGSGNANRYRLGVAPLAADGAAGSANAGNARSPGQVAETPPSVETPAPAVKYSEDTTRRIRWFPSSGLSLHGPVARIVAAIFFAAWVAVCLFLTVLLIAAANADRSSLVLQYVLSAGIVATVVWLLIRRWFYLLSDNAAIAPMPWSGTAPHGENVFVVRRDPARKDPPTLHLVRYVADCPVCGGDLGRSAVGIESGRMEFFGRRLVGRCRHAPNAHVWSFDHIALIGRFLR